MPSLSASSTYIGMNSKQPWFVLSAARKFSIATSSNPSVSHYYTFEANSSHQQAHVVPDGCIDIFIDCDDIHPTAVVYGSPLEVSTVSLVKGHRYLGVRFLPGIIPDCLKTSAKELINQHCDLSQVTETAEQALEQIVALNSFEKRIAIIEKVLLKKSSPLTSSKVTLPVVNMICSAKGNIRIKELEDMTGYTIRTLQRTFLNDIGISPKKFSQIIRFQSAVYRVHHDRVTFSDLASELGYSDQSHFLREFKRFNTATPQDYQNFVKQQAYIDKIRLC